MVILLLLCLLTEVSKNVEIHQNLTRLHSTTVQRHLYPAPTHSVDIFQLNKKHLKNFGPIRHCEPPHALILHCHSPGVATVARRLRIDVHDDDDDAWQRGPLWLHRMGPIISRMTSNVNFVNPFSHSKTSCIIMSPSNLELEQISVLIQFVDYIQSTADQIGPGPLLQIGTGPTVSVISVSCVSPLTPVRRYQQG